MSQEEVCTYKELHSTPTCHEPPPGWAWWPSDKVPTLHWGWKLNKDSIAPCHRTIKKMKQSLTATKNRLIHMPRRKIEDNSARSVCALKQTDERTKDLESERR